jgi:hypothetical protein
MEVLVVDTKPVTLKAVQDNLPSNIKALWTSKFIPMFLAYIGTLTDSSNPFIIGELADVVSVTFMKVYGPQPHSRHVASLVPKGIIFRVVHFQLLPNFSI